MGLKMPLGREYWLSDALKSSDPGRESILFKNLGLKISCEDGHTVAISNFLKKLLLQ